VVNREFLDNEVNDARRNISTIAPKNAPRLTLGGQIDVVEGIRGYAANELSFNVGALWCDSPEFATADIPYFAENDWIRTVAEHKTELIMASGEVLYYSGADQRMQIANPGAGMYLTPSEQPLVGFKGAVNLANLWRDALLC
jgi:hypothetical protein